MHVKSSILFCKGSIFRFDQALSTAVVQLCLWSGPHNQRRKLCGGRFAATLCLEHLFVAIANARV